MSKYINLETPGKLSLSRTACALLLPLAILANKNNEIDKKQFMQTIHWIKDYRTWNKYWEELIANNILVRLDKNTWMVSPHEFYTDDISHNSLINKWNEVCNALK